MKIISFFYLSVHYEPLAEFLIFSLHTVVGLPNFKVLAEFLWTDGKDEGNCKAQSKRGEKSIRI